MSIVWLVALSCLVWMCSCAPFTRAVPPVAMCLLSQPLLQTCRHTVKYVPVEAVLDAMLHTSMVQLQSHSPSSMQEPVSHAIRGGWLHISILVRWLAFKLSCLANDGGRTDLLQMPIRCRHDLSQPARPQNGPHIPATHTLLLRQVLLQPGARARHSPVQLLAVVQ